MTSPRSFYVVQPTAATNEAALGQLLGTPGGRRLDIAIAYVTNPGVTALEAAALAGTLPPKRYHIGALSPEMGLLANISWLARAIQSTRTLPPLALPTHPLAVRPGLDVGSATIRIGAVSYTHLTLPPSDIV